MPLGGDYNSPEKQAIRESLWDAAVQDLIDNHSKKGESLKLLDLPGARCTYLKQVIEKFGVVKENITGVERLTPDFLSIHHFLGGRGVALQGNMEDLCERRELRPCFPFDVVNLDFCGQGFIFPDLTKVLKENTEYQRRWGCVKSVIDFNREMAQDVWYLLLTLGCDRNNEPGKNYLFGQLEDLRTRTGIDKNPAMWKDDRLIQEVVPKIVAAEALERDYVL